MLLELLAMLRPAEACSCIAPSPQRSPVLADGALDFPVDGNLRVLLYAFPPALRARMGEEYRLRDDTGALVPVVATVDDTVLTLAPDAPLRGDAQYVIERVFAYDADGVRLSDGERWEGVRPVRPSENRVAERLWFTEASFHTAGGAAHRSVPTVAVRDAKVYFASGGGDCGPGTSLSFEFDTDGELPPGDLFVAQVQGHGDIGSFTAREGGMFGAGDMLCTPDKVHLGYQGPFDVRIDVLHADGTRTEATPWVRASPESPPPKDVRERQEYLDSATYDAWFEPPAADPPPTHSSSPAPASCPFGLERSDTTRLGPDVFSWLSPEERWRRDEGEVEWNEQVVAADAMFVLLNGPHWSRAVAIAPGVMHTR
jgi:hypothetical protein